MAVMKEPFGSTQDGRAVDQYTLRCGHLEAEVLTYGAALRLLQVPDRNGEHVDVVLGYDSVSGYEDNGGYLGAVIGRYANRIAGARCVIDGRVVPLAANEGPKQLHGGPAGFDKQCFEARQTGESAVTFTYASLDGEGGFPGGLSAQVTYTLSEQGLSLHYEASADQTTYCNLTNHSYFNLNGGGDAMHHRLWLSSSRYTPVGPDSIPTAMARPVAGSPFDFTAEKPSAGTSTPTTSSCATWAAMTTTSSWTPSRGCAGPPASRGTAPASLWRCGRTSPDSSSTPPTA